MVKKLLCGAFAMVLALTSLAGCKQSGNASSSSIEEAPASLAPKDELMDYDEYTMEAYLKPYWYTREVYNETIMFVGAEDEARLMYDASEIISVRNYYLDTEYYEGIDWTYENGVFRRTEKSAIPYWNVEEYYTTEPGRFSIGVDKNKIQYELEGKRYLKYAEGNAFTCKQIAITYRHDMPWEGPVPVGKSQRFSKTLQKIKNGFVTNILLFGDSISTGCRLL